MSCSAGIRSSVIVAEVLVEYPVRDLNTGLGYSTIQEAINNAADGDTVFVNTGTYYEHVVINKTLSLIGEGASTTIIDGNETGRVIDILSNNVNVTGFTVQRSGSLALPDLDAGICLNGTRGCRITNNNILDNGGFGIHLLESNQNTVSGNNLTDSGGFAISLTASSENTISSNLAMHNLLNGIGIHALSHDNIISGNTVANSARHGIMLNNARNCTILGNRLTDNNETGIWIQAEAYNNTISENNIADSLCGIKIEWADNNTISGNRITGGRFGVAVNSSRYAEICRNMIAHNYGSGHDAGLILDSAGYTLIHDNEITDNWRGILLEASSPNVSIYGNNVTSNEFGIRVFGGGSSFLNVSGNFVANNRGYGVGVTGIGGGSNYAVISRNVIVNNIDGIALGEGSSYNTVVQNNISGNEYGIGMQYSTQNSILSNNIVNNIQQVSIPSGSVNAWNGTYALGGNYWSDYSGLDQFSGPYQNVTGSDGIGDNPYVIDAANKDNYPLMKPWVPQALTTDINDDGKVNILDITIVAKAFGSKQGEPAYNEAADLDKNGQVNIIDISMVAKDYGETI